MTSGIRDTVRSLLRLAAGEAGSRVGSFVLFAYISRKLGVEVLGIVALAQTVAAYVICGTDAGLRYIGARLTARDSSLAPAVVSHLLKKRVVLAAISIAVGSFYALRGPVPAQARLYVLCFVLAVLPYAFSLDWLAWGLNRMGWLGAWRAGVSWIFVLGAIAGIYFTGRTFASITLAYGASTTLGSVILWFAWRFIWSKQEIPKKNRLSDTLAKTPSEITTGLGWGPVMALGLAIILNQMFTNFDTIMLGAMSTTAEVGRYNAAYKVLFLIFGAYYLLTQTLYPKLSAARGGRHFRTLVIKMVVGVAALGSVATILVGSFASDLLRLIYGSGLNATPLLRILSFAIPMDFCVALLGTVFVSRGRDRVVLVTGAISAGANITMNWFLIPRMGALGAAWATVWSYVVLLTVFLFFLWRMPLMQHESISLVESEPVAIP